MQVLPSQNDALAVANSTDSFTMFYLAKIMPSATAMFFLPGQNEVSTNCNEGLAKVRS